MSDQPENNGKHPATPGYFDLQVNGYAGADFNNDHLTAESLHQACAAMHRDGVAGSLATIITDDLPAMERRLKRLVELRAADPCVRRVLWAIHIEGPFINNDPAFAGAHPVDAVQPASVDVMQRLIDAGDGLVRLVTLAPEQDPDLTVTRMLHEQGIVVGAGHTDASVEQLDRAAEAGLSLFTHLGNGCPVQMDRHDNIVQRVLWVARRRPLWVSFIADGAHIPFFALENYLDTLGMERCVVVSDAIAAAGLGPGRYTLGRHHVEIGDDLVPRSPNVSHLFGSATTIKRMATNLQQHVGLGPSQVDALTRSNPRRLMGLSQPLDSDPKDAPPGVTCCPPESSGVKVPRL